MRIVQSFNQCWLFCPEALELTAPDSVFEVVTLPHTNKLFAHRFVDNYAYQFVSTYRKRFEFTDAMRGKRVFLDFDGAMLASTVYLNGVLLGVHQGGYTPFSFELTGQLTPGENVVTVYVDATENERIPPYGRLVDFLTFGGLYRDVALRIVDPVHIVNVFVRTPNALAQPSVVCDVQLTQREPGLTLAAALVAADGRTIAEHMQPVTAEHTALVLPDVGPVALWQLDAPILYTLQLRVLRDGTVIDDHAVRFGFRTAEFSGDGQFLLNGAPLKLFGLNRHQTYPYIGAAAPARLQRLDADIIKFELGCNVVRAAHYAQSPHFINRCDEIGLLVFEELAGWQFIGDADWQELAVQDLQTMIMRDRNHPSIILWGVRINESPDDDVFYARTNALARDLDPTRQTGGVRDFIASHCLEDVFTLNDFTPGLIEPKMTPHLITEYGGHRFPTKVWDHEERRVEHALVHARKQDTQMGHPGIAGAIGWCAFDYNTHKEFGSGDRICYHGVMDIFRLPKFAAYFYRSQKAPDDEIVLYAATNWTMGDRSGGGNNPLVIFSNCDEIEVAIGDEVQGCFAPSRSEYPHLEYPPFVLRWPEPYNPWGTEFRDLTVTGFIDGEQVAQQIIAADHLPDRLEINTHTAQLQADGADMARVAVQIVDRYGNVLPYQLRVIEFALEGDAAFIGENPLALMGGQGACFIKAGHRAGPVVVTARTVDLPAVSLTLELVPPA